MYVQVPGVIGALLLRALLRGEVRALWTGSSLPQPQGVLVCDGCGGTVRGEEPIWSDTAGNVDYKPACYAKLPPEKQAGLVLQTVNKRCGIEPPEGAQSTRELM